MTQSSGYHPSWKEKSKKHFKGLSLWIDDRYVASGESAGERLKNLKARDSGSFEYHPSWKKTSKKHA